jgi:flagellar biosynthesis protein FlhB
VRWPVSLVYRRFSSSYYRRQSGAALILALVVVTVVVLLASTLQSDFFVTFKRVENQLHSQQLKGLPGKFYQQILMTTKLVSAKIIAVKVLTKQ